MDTTERIFSHASKVKRFKQESTHRQTDGHTHTHTHTHTRALPNDKMWQQNMIFHCLTLTYIAKVKVDPQAKNQDQRSNSSNRRAPTTNGRTHTHRDTTKRIIFPATRSMNIVSLCTQFDSSSFSHSWDMDGASKI